MAKFVPTDQLIDVIQKWKASRKCLPTFQDLFYTVVGGFEDDLAEELALAVSAGMILKTGNRFDVPPTPLHHKLDVFT